MIIKMGVGGGDDKIIDRNDKMNGMWGGGGGSGVGSKKS